MKSDDILDTFESCKSRWNIESDENTSFMNYPNWIKEMSEPLADIVSSLMPRFEYYSHKIVNQTMVELHGELKKGENIGNENTIYCVLEDKDGRLNSGYEYLIEYRNLNKLSKYLVYPQLSRVSCEVLLSIQNIVYVDDFCGTGNTFINYLEKEKKRIEGKHVYYLVIHIMQQAIERIDKYSKEANLDIHILYNKCADKVFKNTGDFGEKKSEFRKLSMEYGISSRNVLGYNNTEALTAFYNNTPNNTLGIFWQDTYTRKALFPRENDERPQWMKMKNRKKERNGSNYLKGCSNGRIY